MHDDEAILAFSFDVFALPAETGWSEFSQAHVLVYVPMHVPVHRTYELARTIVNAPFRGVPCGLRPMRLAASDAPCGLRCALRTLVWRAATRPAAISS